MANPNIVDVTTIYGETDVLNATTANANVVQNAGASGEVYKVNVFSASNLDETYDQDITLELIRDANSYAIANKVTIPYASTIMILTKDTALYLKEGDALSCRASSNANVQVICSYEVIS